MPLRLSDHGRSRLSRITAPAEENELPFCVVAVQFGATRRANGHMNQKGGGLVSPSWCLTSLKPLPSLTSKAKIEAISCATMKAERGGSFGSDTRTAIPGLNRCSSGVSLKVREANERKLEHVWLRYRQNDSTTSRLPQPCCPTSSEILIELST
ncbi:hypothetical protein IF1G_03430 [Cordyceps javanica]|uniref:Uncharacterized protein n=1 Tax=Cordyceps javanica TaxID=43265 RepID=A0A545V7J4_9HYPO|nr:hypothetical protein IF1G_03430 [Cordyceps javanica]